MTEKTAPIYTYHLYPHTHRNIYRPDRAVLIELIRDAWLATKRDCTGNGRGVLRRTGAPRRIQCSAGWCFSLPRTKTSSCRVRVLTGC